MINHLLHPRDREMSVNQGRLKRICCVLALVCLASGSSFGQQASGATNASRNTLILTNANPAAAAPAEQVDSEDVARKRNLALLMQQMQANTNSPTNGAGQSVTVVVTPAPAANEPLSAEALKTFTADAERNNAQAKSNLQFLIKKSAESEKARVASGELAKLDYNTFRVIPDRNIFNPNRLPGRVNTPTEINEITPTRRTEGLALVGTMAYEKGMYAFFEGSLPAYTGTCSNGSTIAAFKVIEIAYDRVKLLYGAKEIDLPMNRLMRLDTETGEWMLTGETASFGPATLVANRTRTTNTVSRVVDRAINDPRTTRGADRINYMNQQGNRGNRNGMQGGRGGRGGGMGGGRGGRGGGFGGDFGGFGGDFGGMGGDVGAAIQQFLGGAMGGAAVGGAAPAAPATGNSDPEARLRQERVNSLNP